MSLFKRSQAEPEPAPPEDSSIDPLAALKTQIEQTVENFRRGDLTPARYREIITERDQATREAQVAARSARPDPAEDPLVPRERYIYRDIPPNA